MNTQDDQVQDDANDTNDVIDNGGAAETTTDNGDDAGTTGDGETTGDDAGTTGDEAAAAAAGDKVRRDIVPPQYRKLYQENGGNCGDFIAAELSSMIESGGLDSLNSVKVENNVPVARWASLNNGQQRMNLSNTLRASFLRGEPIKIAGKVYDINALRDEFVGEDGAFNPEDNAEADRFLSFISMPLTDRNRAALVRLFVTIPAQVVAKAKREEDKEAKAKEKAEKKAAADAAAAEKKAKGEEPAAEGDTKAPAKPKKSRKKKDVAAAAEAAADASDEAAAEAAATGEEAPAE